MIENWMGKHLIRTARSALLDLPEDAEDVAKVRAAAQSGFSKTDCARLTGIRYARVVWLAAKHRIDFNDGRPLRRRTWAGPRK